MSVLFDLIYTMKLDLDDEKYIRVLRQNDIEVGIYAEDKISCIDNVMKVVKQGRECLVVLDKVIIASVVEKYL